MAGKKRPKAATPVPKRRPAALGNVAQPTVERILERAQDVLVSRGYAKFTMRSVAEAADISPGNLAYHYRTKQDLLRAVVGNMVAKYTHQFEALLADSEQPFVQELEDFVRWILIDSATEYTVRTFRELWAISLHDQIICREVDDMYDLLMSYVAELLQRFRPNASAQAIRESIQLLALITEGTAVLYGTRRERAVSHERIIEIVTQVLDARLP